MSSPKTQITSFYGGSEHSRTINANTNCNQSNSQGNLKENLNTAKSEIPNFEDVSTGEWNIHSNHIDPCLSVCLQVCPARVPTVAMFDERNYQPGIIDIGGSNILEKGFWPFKIEPVL